MEKENNVPAYDETQTVPLAYHEMCMTRNAQEKKRLVIGWAVSVVLAVAICVISFVWLWQQYDYVTTVDNTGVYVVTDANGNVIASDLAPEDVIKIMEDLNGEDTGN